MAFGGRFDVHFGFDFGFVSNHFRRLRRALGALSRMILERFWASFGPLGGVDCVTATCNVIVIML